MTRPYRFLRSSLPLLSVLALAAALGCTKQGAGADAGDQSSSGKSSGTDVSPHGNNLLKASGFDDGKSVPWTTSFTAPADGSVNIEKGALCVEVKGNGSNAWDAQLRHREMTIQKGHTYTLQFKAFASAPTTARPKVGMSGPPYAEYWSATIDIGTEPKLYVGKFTMSNDDDATAELAFHIGGAMAKAPVPFKICIDDIRLDDPDFTPGAGSSAAAAVPNVLVNQVGYLPNAIKVAAFKTKAKEPMEWQLADGGGAVIATGKTTPFGEDAASGDHLQLIDFTSVKKAGQGLTLRVGNDVSSPFDISADVYKKMKYDALAYFYHNRSGIEIKMPFAGDEKLARPAGHLHDNKVKCAPKSGCDYTLDVSGGWYDAGDHGKYVVNGGVSLWTMLNQYERAKAFGSVAEFGDGKMQIPEKGNGVPDILDEARWEMEWMLRMQVPEGKELAGMAHHKMHDEAWTALGTAPHEDKQTRLLFAPSTAATLNLAANAAQCARVWKAIDAGFSQKCLKAAERAWAAARKNPKIMASPTINGGGAYDDANIGDEFYWAAAELYATTGKAEYKDFVTSSALDKRFPTEAGGHVSSLNWGTTDAMGMISMAIAPGSQVDKAKAEAIKKQIVAAGDAFLKVQAKEGYRTLLQRTADGKYIWGSNSFVMNNMIVLGLAYDLSKQQKYLDGMVLGMDYLLGRNPLGQSYVTGYGERPLENPHHRFWAFQANAKYPKAPPGVVSGGPNSSIDDPYAKSVGLKGCLPEKCFVDNIEAWSVNEITINWNAPFAWAAAYLDEKAQAK